MKNQPPGFLAIRTWRIRRGGLCFLGCVNRRVKLAWLDVSIHLCIFRERYRICRPGSATGQSIGYLALLIQVMYGADFSYNRYI